MRIYNCSNSSERPASNDHRGNVENSVVTLLKKHAHQYGAQFVDSPKDANVLFTNDIYPKALQDRHCIRIKRMDGIFWQKALIDRNIPLNAAACQSDLVIFISEYSRTSFQEATGTLPKKHIVVLNAVDSDIFYPPFFSLPPKFNPPKRLDWIAVATNWGRKQKRLEGILSFADIIRQDGGTVYLIGKVPEEVRLPENVDSLGSLADPVAIATHLRLSDAFVNMSFRDAAPKVVAEALSCGLPVLYANSGGVPELIPSGCGIGIDDVEIPKYSEVAIDYEIPSLPVAKIKAAYDRFIMLFPDLQKAAAGGIVNAGKDMVGKYFQAFRETLECGSRI